MRRIDDPFLVNLPSIDLHGLDRITAVIKTKEFINDSVKSKTYDIIVVHGRGSGILRRTIHEYLKKDRRVISYKTDNFNDGVTVIKLKGEEV